MTILYEDPHAGSFIMSMDDDGNLSRDNGVVKSGEGVLKPGAVLASIVTATVAAAAKAGNTGNGVFTPDATTPALAGAQAGVYRVVCTAAAANGGTFRVFDPNGDVLGDVAVGATFADQIKFSIADGATDFIVGDEFDVTVSAPSEKWVAYDETKTDGSQIATGILYARTDATSADAKAAAVRRHAEVRGSALIYKAGATAAGKSIVVEHLKKNLIVAR